ncbi:MAG: acyltransferase family protein [Clostridia bacterium]|nr:acyltransferase family protein [Clostridia bacterium]
MNSGIVEKRENFNAVDLAKFIMAFCVIAIHTCMEFFSNGIANTIVSTVIVRLAVPFFFVASGFFFFRDIIFENGKIKKCPENRSRFLKTLKRLTLLYVLWAIIYFVWQFYTWYDMDYLHFANLRSYVLNFFTAGFDGVFWYVVSSIYAMIILWFLLRHLKVGVVAGIVTVLCAVFFLVYTYADVLRITALNNVFSKVFEFVSRSDALVIVYSSLYFVMIAVVSIFLGFVAVRLREKISTGLSGILTIASLCFSVLENVLIYTFRDGKMFSYTFFLLPTVFFGFIFLTKVRLNGNQKTFDFFRKASTFIYCFHHFFVNVVNYCTGYTFEGMGASFFITCAVSATAALIIVLLSNKVKFLKNLY